MSSTVKVFIDDQGKPTNIPDYETIITQLPLPTSAVCESPSSLDKRSEHDVSNIWVKSGRNITMGEARTQRFDAQHLQDSENLALAFTWGNFGYIVTEYIDGQTCDNSDIALVAAAVQVLINIPSPNLTPGPVGGGLIEHPFFVDGKSSIRYESVEELQNHVNGILSETERRGRVSFTTEVANHGLRLCVSDLIPVNFMRDRDNN
ncbi:unnamed protein product [Cyclocybe aegerita]|uniref:Uncharacterized protein n=1 Tax=Cyclocybe aegerita TaxID=1973307 RepID=A0A8S0WZA4_CYCAE|nr:unnamed protein product [Cyclocybe aegerita]